MTYENLIDEAYTYGVTVKEIPLKYNLKGLYKNNKIIIDQTIPTIEKKCIMAEELGHHHKTVGNILDESDISNCKQEIIARRWGYEKLVGIVDFVNAYRDGAKNRYELANYLAITEKFLDEVVAYYRNKYGTYCEIDNYLIYFEPHLGIIEMF